MKFSVYTLAVVLLVTASCSKKKKDTPYDPTGALAAIVKTATHSNTGLTENYTYTSDGKVQQIQSSAGSKTTFDYTDSTITQTNFDNGGAVVSITNYTVDTFGMVSGAVVTDAGGTITGFHGYSFDYSHHQTADTKFDPSYIPNGKIERTWGNDNMIEYAIYDSTISHKDYDSYLWYYDPAVTSIGNANTGQKFFGADSKYLVRKTVGATWGAGNVVYTYEYTFDSKERITEAKTFDYAGTLKNTDTYTYY